MILGIQIIGIIFGLLMIYFSFLHYKRQEFSKIQFLFWEIVWGVFILIVVFPKITNGIVHKMGVNRAMDLLTILGLMFITFMTFYNYTSIYRLKQKLEEKVRKETLRELDK
ncbi:DUF2304 domain-containing protein [Patescibacteria group bacterium]|nr:DUF2304 domain-containing protein [Patescibacteria group bacterium]MBU2579459.1 DUF2304 domain-containing protein [Patescibacteria group bacterium]MBU4031149.1 DUF2304 domain-containing protein [Patescibacteria group bacterium]MCG2701303.1 DUF2304 domain-containing protein [Candidatus Parcubacteria bacterium]MCG2809042.1 DUF2304 domain-containing protein [Candidatus Portnoybacteria bacterium]